MKHKQKKRIRVNYLLISIFFLIIVLWFFLSFFRTIYNLSKLFTEDLSIAKLSDREEYEIFEQVIELTPSKSSILVIAPGSSFLSGFSYELLYFLYPRNITYESDTQKFEKLLLNHKYNFAFLLLPKSDDSFNRFILGKGYPSSTINFIETKNLRGVLIKYE